MMFKPDEYILIVAKGVIFKIKTNLLLFFLEKYKTKVIAKLILKPHLHIYIIPKLTVIIIYLALVFLPW